MNVKKIMLLVGALVIAAITAIMAKNMFAGAGAQEARARSEDERGRRMHEVRELPHLY